MDPLRCSVKVPCRSIRTELGDLLGRYFSVALAYSDYYCYHGLRLRGLGFSGLAACGFGLGFREPKALTVFLYQLP